MLFCCLRRRLGGERRMGGWVGRDPHMAAPILFTNLNQLTRTDSLFYHQQTVSLPFLRGLSSPSLLPQTHLAVCPPRERQTPTPCQPVAGVKKKEDNYQSRFEACMLAVWCTINLAGLRMSAVTGRWPGLQSSSVVEIDQSCSLNYACLYT